MKKLRSEVLCWNQLNAWVKSVPPFSVRIIFRILQRCKPLQTSYPEELLVKDVFLQPKSKSNPPCDEVPKGNLVQRQSDIVLRPSGAEQSFGSIRIDAGQGSPARFPDAGYSILQAIELGFQQ
jgi:hypothetical protein